MGSSLSAKISQRRFTSSVEVPAVRTGGDRVSYLVFFTDKDGRGRGFDMFLKTYLSLCECR